MRGGRGCRNRLRVEERRGMGGIIWQGVGGILDGGRHEGLGIWEGGFVYSDTMEILPVVRVYCCTLESKGNTWKKDRMGYMDIVSF